jgi:hypothetical protein
MQCQGMKGHAESKAKDKLYMLRLNHEYMRVAMVRTKRLLQRRALSLLNPDVMHFGVTHSKPCAVLGARTPCLSGLV